MKKIILSLSLIAAVVSFTACGGEKAKEGEDKKTEEKEEESTGDEETTGDETISEKIECGEPMNSFMGMLKGSFKDVEAALTQYGAEGLERNDMDIYDLSEPTVVACSKSETGECCTMEAKAGMTIRTYDICWEGDKITSITDKGMR